MMVGMVRPAQITKITSLQNLRSILRKKWEIKFIFFEDEYHSYL